MAKDYATYDQAAVKAGTTAYYVGHDQMQTDNTRLIGSPLSPAFPTEAKAREALAEIALSTPEAYLVERRTFR